MLHIQVVGSKLYVNGDRLHLKGVNWLGSEGGIPQPPSGLHAHTVEYYLEFLRQNKFNAVRILVRHTHAHAVYHDPAHRTWGVVPPCALCC